MTRCFRHIYRVFTSARMARKNGLLIELFCLLVTTVYLWSGAKHWSMDGSLMLLPNQKILVDRPRFIKSLIVVFNNSEYGKRYRRRDNAIRRDLLNVKQHKNPDHVQRFSLISISQTTVHLNPSGGGLLNPKEPRAKLNWVQLFHFPRSFTFCRHEGFRGKMHRDRKWIVIWTNDG